MARGERIAYELETGGFAEGQLVVWALHGREALNEPFAFSVRIGTPDGDPLDLAALLGGEATLTLRRPDGSERVVHGEVGRARLAGVAAGVPTYELQLVPRLARLAHAASSRIFQDVTVPDLVAEVLDAHGVKHRAALGSYPQREYVVQHQETDLAFVSRLLEEEGIGFCFEHEAGAHTLVLFDAADAGPSLDEVLPLRQEEQGDGDVFADRLAAGAALQPQAAALRDFDFQRPALTLEARSGSGALERYEYPAGIATVGEGRARAGVRLAQSRVRAATWEGVTTALGLSPGTRFEVDGTPRLRCVSVVHEGQQERRPGGELLATYRNAFRALSGDEPWRPPRRTPRPRAHGLETALVTGPGGEEINVDAHGRVKVQFHWDRQGQRDDRSSCWVRVAQAWAGAGMGASVVPRIGQEVLIRFLAGDADRPLLVGAVYDGQNRTPVSLPDDRTRSTHRSASSLGSDGFNELSFQDQAGAERVYLHAQRDLVAEVGNDRTAQVRGDEAVAIGGDLDQTILGRRTRAVGEDQASVVGGGETTLIAAARGETVGGDDTQGVGQARSLTVGGARTVGVAAASAETVGAAGALTVGGAYAISVGLASNVAVGGALLQQVVGAKTVVVNKSQEERVGKDRSLRIMGEDRLEIREGLQRHRGEGRPRRGRQAAGGGREGGEHGAGPVLPAQGGHRHAQGGRAAAAQRQELRRGDLGGLLPHHRRQREAHDQGRLCLQEVRRGRLGRGPDAEEGDGQGERQRPRPHEPGAGRPEPAGLRPRVHRRRLQAEEVAQGGQGGRGRRRAAPVQGRAGRQDLPAQAGGAGRAGGAARRRRAVPPAVGRPERPGLNPVPWSPPCPAPSVVPPPWPWPSRSPRRPPAPAARCSSPCRSRPWSRGPRWSWVAPRWASAGSRCGSPSARPAWRRAGGPTSSSRSGRWACGWSGCSAATRATW
ncbi:MAG: type VI secretion system tip protein TssI/VgrG [Anaeromyxobacter sp.]